jgi:hypothetical protein
MDPESGTFVSVDPVVPDAGDPQSYNAYVYARNNPVSRVDPTGEASWWIPASLSPSGIDTLVIMPDAPAPSAPPALPDLGAGMGGLSALGGLSGISPSTPANNNPSNNQPTQVAHSEHTKDKRQSTKGKHEKGEARKARDQGRGDKAQQSGSKQPPRKPPQGWTKEGKWPPSNRAWERWLKGTRGLPPIIIFPGMLEGMPGHPEAPPDQAALGQTGTG